MIHRRLPRPDQDVLDALFHAPSSNEAMQQAEQWVRDVVQIDPGLVPVDGIRQDPSGEFDLIIEQMATDHDGQKIVINQAHIREDAVAVTFADPEA